MVDVFRRIEEFVDFCATFDSGLARVGQKGLDLFERRRQSGQIERHAPQKLGIARLAGGFDAFVARIDTNASGVTSLIFCSYLGGAADDKGYGLALDVNNDVYVAGQTSSPDFPVLNPAQPARGGNFDAFVARLNSTGTKLYAT